MKKNEKVDRKKVDSIVKRWTAALRSGKYSQAKGALFVPDEGYCCLGVLEHVLSGGKVECNTDFGDLRISGMPTNKWLEQNGLEFLKYGELMNKLVVMNDGDELVGKEKVSFKRIANFLESKEGIEKSINEYEEAFCAK